MVRRGCYRDGEKEGVTRMVRRTKCDGEGRGRVPSSHIDSPWTRAVPLNEIVYVEPLCGVHMTVHGLHTFQDHSLGVPPP